jgi:hypothetical protein
VCVYALVTRQTQGRDKTTPQVLSLQRDGKSTIHAITKKQG